MLWAGRQDVSNNWVRRDHMRVQIQHKRSTKRTDRGDGAAESVQDQPTSDSEQLREEMEDILDEIDAVLESNAEQFVMNYIQKGGE